MSSKISQKFIGSLIVFSISLLFFACTDKKKDDVVVEEKAGINLSTTGTATLKFQHYFKDSIFSFSPSSHITLGGDTIKVTDLKYYVSNVRFYHSDGTYWNAKNYDLVDATVASNVVITGIPAGNYTKVACYIGVDTPYNHSLDHPSIDALDPAHGMSWGWSTGYVFTRIKGYHSNQLGFSFDLGGDDHLINLEFDVTGYKLTNSSVELDLKTDVNQFFENPNTYHLKTQSTAIHAPTDPEVALFIANMNHGMFTLTNVK